MKTNPYANPKYPEAEATLAAMPPLRRTPGETYSRETDEVFAYLIERHPELSLDDANKVFDHARYRVVVLYLRRMKRWIGVDCSWLDLSEALDHE